MKLNLITEPLSLLYTEGAIIVGTVYIFLPLMIISLVGVMENIENDLLEAAESLGANKIVAFFKVIFPLSLPGLYGGLNSSSALDNLISSIFFILSNPVYPKVNS